MQKVVAGIIAVFCLQASFQAYLAVDQGREEYRTWSKSSALNDPLGDFPLEAASVDQEQPSVDTVTVDGVPVVHRAISDRQVLASYRKPFAPAFKRESLTAGNNGFKPVTITYAAPVRYQQATYVERTPALLPTQRPVKRSLPNKALAVIKKPYDWLKAFASKFKG